MYLLPLIRGSRIGTRIGRWTYDRFLTRLPPAVY
jgi:hypothetical protein